MFLSRKATMVAPADALPGRAERPFHVADRHRVLDAPVITDEVPDGLEVAFFGLGCFWGAEEIYWQIPGVWSTSVGYAGGFTPHPTYEEVCSGGTGHTEAVRVVFDPAVVSYADLVKRFFEVHDPTQGMRQGNDVGTQYRSAIYPTTPAQEATALELDRGVRRRARPSRPGRDHHRGDLRRRPAAVLVCRGRAPAVPGEEPLRVPLPREHRRPVPVGSASLRRVGGDFSPWGESGHRTTRLGYNRSDECALTHGARHRVDHPLRLASPRACTRTLTPEPSGFAPDATVGLCPPRRWQPPNPVAGGPTPWDRPSPALRRSAATPPGSVERFRPAL